MKRLLTALAALTCLIAAPLAAQAVAIVVDTQDFGGIWYVLEGNLVKSGYGRTVIGAPLPPTVQDLDPGAYNLQFGGSSLTRIGITVAGDGTVTSDNPTALVASGNTLTLQTTTATIDHGAFEGQTLVLYAGGYKSATYDIVLVKNQAFALQLGDSSLTRKNLKVEADGTLTLYDPSITSVAVSGSTATVQTVPVQVNAHGFPGRWQIARSTKYVGDRLVHIPPDEEMLFQIGGGNPRPYVTVTPAGVVSEITDHPAITVSGSVVDFQTVSFDVLQGDSGVDWFVREVMLNWANFDDFTVVALPGMSYLFQVGNYGQIYVDLDATGQVVASSKPSALSVLDASTLRFNAFPVTVDPGAYSGSWKLPRVDWGPIYGPRTFNLVPDLGYDLSTPEAGTNVFFNLDGAGAPTVATPSSLAVRDGIVTFRTVDMRIVTDRPDLAVNNTAYSSLTGSDTYDRTFVAAANVQVTEPSQGWNLVTINANCTATPSSVTPNLATMTFSCSPDADGDYVRDARDNCPLHPNEWQEDADGDGVGDACDCAAGYQLDAPDGSCVDVDECATGNGGCDQTCNNAPGGFACACNAGYTLDAGGFTCVIDAIGVCAEPTCADGVKNGGEPNVDCGGPCPPCADAGARCRSGGDCASRVCRGGVCAAAACDDGVYNGAETGVDCGGGCGGCPGVSCSAAGDCASGRCAGTCLTPTCGDGVKNGAETAVDCGGRCDGCDPGDACRDGGDCASGACQLAMCQLAACNDGVHNGAETGLDCGGPDCLACPGAIVSGPGECAHGVWDGVDTCTAPGCADGVINGAETDLDCGGGCAPCPDGGSCLVAGDCFGASCVAGQCAAPSCADGITNGAEGGVDCGGSCATTCTPCVGAVVTGDVTVREQADLDAYACTEEITGDLIVDPATTVTAIALPSLTTLGGGVRVDSHPTITALSLPNLRGAVQEIYLYNNSALAAVDLGQVQQVASVCVIQQNPITALKLGPITAVGSILSIRDVLDADWGPFGPALTSVGSVLHILDNANVTSVAMPNLTSLAGEIVVRDNPELATLDLGDVGAINGQISVSGNPLLANLSLGSPTSVSTVLTISDTLATTLDLQDLTSVGGNLTVRDNANLADPGLTNPALTVGGANVYVLNNPALCEETVNVLQAVVVDNGYAGAFSTSGGLDCYPTGSAEDPATSCLGVQLADPCAPDGDYVIDPDGHLGPTAPQLRACAGGWTSGTPRFTHDSQLEWKSSAAPQCQASGAHPFAFGMTGFHGIATSDYSHHLVASAPDVLYGELEVSLTLSQSWGWASLGLYHPDNFDVAGRLIGWNAGGGCGIATVEPYVRVANNGSNDMASLSWSIGGSSGSANNGVGNGLDPAFPVVVTRDAGDIVTIRHDGVTVWTSPSPIPGPLRVAADVQNNPTATGHAPDAVSVDDLTVRWRGPDGATPAACALGCGADGDCDDQNPCTTDTCSGGACVWAANDGYSEPCYDGAVGTAGTASCAAGSHTCSGGAFGACGGQSLPTSEACDGADNDCDGLIDDKAALPYVVAGCRDIAATGVASASSSFGAQLPDNVLDACTGAWSAGGDVAWWQVELPEERLIDGVAMRPTMSPNGAVRHQIQLAGSDGIFTTALDVRQTMEDAQAYAFALPAPTLAKYIRINTLENTSWTAWVQVSVFTCGQECAVDADCPGGSTCQDDFDRRVCLDVNECAGAPCAHGGACNNTDGGFTCDCAGTGYVGATCEVDADECAPNPCGGGQTCTDLRPPAGPTACVASPAGQLAWWTGDVNAADQVGGYNGVFAGNATVTAGQTEGAFTFDGTGDEVRVTALPSELNPGAGSFSIELWFRATRVTDTFENLVIRHQFNADPLLRKRWSVSVNTGANAGRLTYLMQDGAGVSVKIDGVAQVRDGSWHHAALVLDRDTGLLRSYVDGVNDGYNNLGALGPVLPDALVVLGNAFEGQLDEVSVYGAALGGDDIAAIHAAGAAGKCIAASFVCSGP